ncbi:hypothetical protein ABEB36_004059 [Hypothenemus hampei]|uniref:Uncharacterized protein n=1 Tax=Hypothenemus hampei TaxID=57062 RepID=A0ABD1F210_HYPHA
MDADDMQGYGTDMLLLKPYVVLKVNITQAIAQIQPDLCGRVVENWPTQIRATVRSRGGHLNDVISRSDIFEQKLLMSKTAKLSIHRMKTNNSLSDSNYAAYNFKIFLNINIKKWIVYGNTTFRNGNDKPNSFYINLEYSEKL